MNSSEKKTYLIAILIVVVGTIVITTGFTFGLLFLTESDNRIHAPGRLPFSIKSENLLSDDIPIDNNEWIIPIEIPSIDESIYKTETETEETEPEEIETEETEPVVEEGTTSLDEYRQATKVIENFRKSHTVDRRTGNRWILIDKSNFILTLNNRNGVLREWEIAVGMGKGNKRNKGDNRTPTGAFTISQIQDSSKWTHDFKDGKGEIEGAYGPWFIRLKTPPWTGIGIHGTHDPDSIGERASEGCIRMSNEDVSELKKLVKVGMAVIIVE